MLLNKLYLTDNIFQNIVFQGQKPKSILVGRRLGIPGLQQLSVLQTEKLRPREGGVSPRSPWELNKARI